MTTELVGTKKKLTAPQKLKLAKFAYQKFIDPRLRTKETKARQALIDAIVLASDSIPLPELRVLARHGMLHSFSKVDLPYSLLCVTGTKEFVVDNKKVTRPETQRVFKPREWDQYVPETVQAAWGGLGRRPSDTREVDDLVLPKAIPVPCLAHRFGPDSVLKIEERSNNDSGKQAYFSGVTMMTPKIQNALASYYLIAHERLETEIKLAQAACRLIHGCTHYHQILEFWPEAKEIEADLFDERLPKALSLVTISDEDKAALCRNMKARGVKGSSVCKAA